MTEVPQELDDEVPVSGERLLIAYEAVVCRVRVGASGVELCWLSGPPDAEPSVSIREVVPWEILESDEGRKSAVQRCWYLSEVAVPRSYLIEVFKARYKQDARTGRWNLRNS